MNFEKDLNEKQLEAVTTSYPNVRIIAGAGSGKTRVLTYRIAYLISELNVLPWKILAITFTNKVANEMKSRVIKMIPKVEKRHGCTSCSLFDACMPELESRPMVNHYLKKYLYEETA